MAAAYDVERPLADLATLAERTGGPDGGRRIAWTDEWETARRWLLGELEAIGATVRRDAAGNLWAELAGERDDVVVVVGSHLDCVPAGGWLDGALGVCGALEVLRRFKDDPPPVTLRLVDWADEEGARFGRSLFGSSAVAGTLEPDDVRALTDADGVALPDALAAHGVELDGIADARGGLDGIAAYLELHIEQGPVLERRGEPAGAVVGCFGVERHAIAFSGRLGHAGSTPMDMRRDAFLSAGRFGLACRESAIQRGGVATIGAVRESPGVPTIINAGCEVTLDQRCLDGEALAAMLADARRASEEIAAEEGCEVSWRTLWSIDPVPFDEGLVDLVARACEEVTGTAHRLPSGALHDCAEVARLAPAVMVFSSSTGGISHSPDEDTPEADLRAALAVYARAVELTLERVARA